MIPSPQLLVEAGQGFVEGWTRLQVQHAISSAVLEERDRCAAIVSLIRPNNPQTLEAKKAILEMIRSGSEYLNEPY